MICAGRRVSGALRRRKAVPPRHAPPLLIPLTSEAPASLGILLGASPVHQASTRPGERGDAVLGLGRSVHERPAHLAYGLARGARDTCPVARASAQPFFERKERRRACQQGHPRPPNSAPSRSARRSRVPGRRPGIATSRPLARCAPPRAGTTTGGGASGRGERSKKPSRRGTHRQPRDNGTRKSRWGTRRSRRQRLRRSGRAREGRA